MSIQLNTFDQAPNDSLVSIAVACDFLSRSRASIYRHIKAGELHIVRLGHSSRIRVGELRQLAGGAL